MLKILKRFIETSDLFKERNFHDFGIGDFGFFKLLIKQSQSPQCRSRGNFFRSINHLFQKTVLKFLACREKIKNICNFQNVSGKF